MRDDSTLNGNGSHKTIFLITAFLLMIHEPWADHRQGAICTNHNASVTPLICPVCLTDSIWHVNFEMILFL